VTAATPCVVGIDGGGTKTACLIAALDGTALGRSAGGPSNYQTVGADATEAVLAQTVQRAAEAAGGSLLVRAICLAMAGVDRPDDRGAITQIAARVMRRRNERFTWEVGPDAVVIVNDAVASLVGGTGRKTGVVTVAGTGSIAFGMSARGERRRAGGWGYALGDEGSGYWIGLAGLRAICRADDGRGARTALTSLVLEEHHLRSPADLIGRVYGQWGVPQIAAIAPLVFRAAAAGDAIARAIVDEAADELALAASAVIRGLGMEREAFEVVTAGSIWQGSEMLAARFTAGVAATAPRARAVPPRDEPVVGATLLAREAIGAADLV